MPEWSKKLPFSQKIYNLVNGDIFKHSESGSQEVQASLGSGKEEASLVAGLRGGRTIEKEAE